MTIEIKELKEGYAEFEKKYKLPSFIDLNRDFELDKIDKKSDFMLRVIRKNVMEKVINSIGFLEMLLNPMNAPRVYYFYIKSMTVQEKQLIEDIYTKLAELSLSSLELEVDYSEKEEAELIKRVFKVWNNLKPNFKHILAGVKKPNNDVKKEKSYFG